MKKLLSILIVSVMLISCVPLAFADTAAALPTIALGESKTVKVDRTNITNDFVFVPDETGEYIFYSSAEDRVDPYGTIYTEDYEYISSSDDFSNGLDFGVVADLEKGETYILSAGLYDSLKKGEYTVSVIKTGLPATEIRPNMTEVIAYVDDYVYIDYELLPFASEYEEVTVTSSDETVFTTDGTELYGVAVGEAVATLSTESGLLATVNVTVKEPVKLTLDTPANVTGGYYSTNLEFTAPATDVYTFEVESDSYSYLTLYDDEHDYINSASGSSIELMVRLREGDTCYAHLSADYEDTASTVTVTKAKKAADIYIDGETNVCVGGEFYYEALSDSGYIFDDIEWSVSDETVATVARGGSDYAYIYVLKEGAFTVTAKLGEDIVATFDVVSAQPAALTVAQPYTESLTGSDSYYVSFTPAENGNYVFDIDDSLAEHEYYNALRFNGDGVITDFPCTRFLEADTTYIIEVRRNSHYYQDGYDESSANVKISVAAETVAEGIELVAERTVACVDQHIGLQAVPTTAGATFENTVEWSIPETYEYFYDYEENAEIAFGEAGEYTVTVSSGDLSDTVTITVKDLETIELDEEKSVTVNDCYGVRFTPKKAGFYTFDVQSDTDVTVSGDEIYSATDDSYAEAVEMYPGQYYDFYVEAEEAANVKIKIRQPYFPDSLKTYTKNITVGVGQETNIFTVFSPNEIYEDIDEGVSSDESIVKCYGDYVIGVAPGTATVTLSSDYGLTATVNITVVDEDYNWADDITLDIEDMNLEIGVSISLEATVVDGASDKVYWQSNDPSVARVDENGRVTGVSEGETYIIAYIDDVMTGCFVTVTKPEIKDTSKVFKDVKNGWYKAAVDYCYSYGFIAGTSTDTFGRDTNVTRGMFITILARIAGVDTSKAANQVTTKFTDVKSGKYYTAAIKWANDNGVVAGTSDTTFGPEKEISRQDLCVMVVNFAKFMEIELTASKDEITFADAASIRKYAKDAVKTCQMAEIVSGYNEKSGVEFKPTKTATRAEAAQILYKFHSDFIAK